MRRFIDGREVDLPESNAEVSADGDRLRVRSDRGATSAVAVRKGKTVWVSYQGRQYQVERHRPKAKGGGGLASGEIRAPMPGVIADLMVKEGDTVEQGARLVVLEAMKTQQPFSAPFSGIVTKVLVSKGQQVGDGDLLVFLQNPADNAG